jgi:hypothetical protein
MTQQELKTAFEKIYGQPAHGLYFAPGRVNFNWRTYRL